jgi:hypothetical protein
MAKYVFQLRRGTRYVDNNGATLLNTDGTPVRDDWTTYTAQEEHVDPLEGEMVLEYEVNPTTGKKTPRIKIGDGESTFAQLEYMSVDSFILPTPAMVHLSTNWKQDVDNRYYQVVKVQNAAITPNSKVDLQISPEDLTIFHEKDLAFVAENEDGVVKVYCVGQIPQNEYDVQCTVTEVVTNDLKEAVTNG